MKIEYALEAVVTDGRGAGATARLSFFVHVVTKKGIAMSNDARWVFLKFDLQVDDGWPPVAVESLPFERCEDGFRLADPPLFVRDLSVGDVIAAHMDGQSMVETWRYIHQSRRTTVWLLRLKRRGQESIERTLERARSLGCNTAASTILGSYAIDVPEDVGIWEIDALVSGLDSDEVGVAFPSMRHPE